MTEGAASASPPRTVLYLTTSLQTLGPATALVELSLRLDPRRYTPVVLQLDRSRNGRLENRLRQGGVALHSLGVSNVAAVASVSRLARRVRASVVHTRLVRADFIGRLAGRLAGVPLILTNLCDVYTRHFADRHGPSLGWWLRRLDSASLNLAHHIVTNAEGIRDDLIANRIRKAAGVTTIPNGVDTGVYSRSSSAGAEARRTLGLAPDAWVIGTVGRLSSKKRLDVLIDALTVIRPQARNVHLLVVGEGELRGALEARARDRGVAGVVTFAGARSDVPALLSAMDTFAFPSQFEGCPNAVLEAMSCGLPVAGADAPGTRELIVDGQTGALVPVGDPAGLAAALLEYSDRGKARGHGAAGRLRVEQHFSLDVMSERFQALYDRHLSQERYP